MRCLTLILLLVFAWCLALTTLFAMLAVGFPPLTITISCC